MEYQSQTVFLRKSGFTASFVFISFFRPSIVKRNNSLDGKGKRKCFVAIQGPLFWLVPLLAVTMRDCQGL